MATSLDDLTGLTTTADGDLLLIQDISDTTDGATGTSKSITKSNLVGDTSSYVTLTGTQTLTNKTLTTPTLTSPVLNTGVSGTAVADEDDMSSDSATLVATQQSIKAYVDSGTVTMTNKTLTSPTITSATLNTAVSGTAVLDEDAMGSDSATQVATQQSIKAYVDNKHNVQSRAYQAAGTAQSIDSASWTKVTLDTENYDVGSDFDAATNYRFTAPANGYYACHAQVGIATLATAKFVECALYVDGSNYSSARHYNWSGGDLTTRTNHSDIIYMASASYVELYVYHDDGSAAAVDGGTTDTFLSVHQIGF